MTNKLKFRYALDVNIYQNYTKYFKHVLFQDTSELQMHINCAIKMKERKEKKIICLA